MVRYGISYNYSNYPIGFAWYEERWFDTIEERKEFIEWLEANYFVKNMKLLS